MTKATTGYAHCACRDCFEVVLASGTFCDACFEADCYLDQECYAPHAYGDDEADCPPEHLKFDG